MQCTAAVAHSCRAHGCSQLHGCVDQEYVCTTSMVEKKSCIYGAESKLSSLHVLHAQEPMLLRRVMARAVQRVWACLLYGCQQQTISFIAYIVFKAAVLVVWSRYSIAVSLFILNSRWYYPSKGYYLVLAVLVVQVVYACNGSVVLACFI